MKKITLILLTGLLFFSACESILDKEPLDLITDNQVWSDPALIDAYITMQYNLTSVMVQESRAYMETYSNGSPVNNLAVDIHGTEHSYGPLAINNFSDEGKGGWDISSGAVGWKAGRVTVNTDVLIRWWENGYYVIRNLNTLIERLPESMVDEAYATQRIAEARWLRAFNYFNIVKRYGGCPLITEVQAIDDPEEELYPERAKEQAIYDFIISECDAIAEDLGEAVNYGRPNKWATLHLKSRAAVYAGSVAKYGTVDLNGVVGIAASPDLYFQDAYDAAKEIIDNGPYALLDDGGVSKSMNFRNIFVTKKHSEVILAKQHNYVDALTAGGGSWSYDHVQSPKPHGWNIGMGNTPYLELAEAFEYIDGTSGTLDRTELESKLWSMEELWGNKDPRFHATLWTMETPWRDAYVDFHHGLITPDGTILENETESYEGVPAWGNQWFWIGFGTGFGVMKYLDEGIPVPSTWGGSGTDYQVFRYAETLLNFAEAAVELGGHDAEALDAINQLRTRAGIATLGGISLDQVRHERRVELALEGHRFWDLRRWRLAEEVLTGSFSGLRYILDYTTRNYKIDVIENYDKESNAPNFYSKMYYFPITNARTAQNPSLVENPGYE